MIIIAYDEAASITEETWSAISCTVSPAPLHVADGTVSGLDHQPVVRKIPVAIPARYPEPMNRKARRAQAALARRPRFMVYA